MSKEQRALVRHLFSEITRTLEVAHSLATEGQRPDLKSLRERAIAHRILNAIDDAAALATAIGALNARTGDPRSARGARSRSFKPRRRVSKTV